MYWDDDMTIVKKLKNGITVVAESMPSFRSLAINVWSGAGAIYESDEEAGISHFIEHMVFKGTKKRTASQIAAEMDAVGGSINAFTAKECTCFYAKVLGEDMDLACDILSDIVYAPLLSETDIEKEKGVVTEEILMLQDNPEDLVHETLCETIYGSAPLASPILGTEATVRSFGREKIQTYMGSHYAPENMVISCAGNFNEDKLTDVFERWFCAQHVGEKRQAPKSELIGQRRYKTVERDVEQMHICLGFPGFASDTREQYTLYVLNNAFGGSMSSRLFQSIREEKGLAYSVYSYPACYGDTGYFALYAGTGEKQALQVVEMMLDEVDKLKKDGLTSEEFQRSKDQLKGGYLLGQESTASRSSAIGKAQLLIGRIQTEQEVLKKIESVTMEDVEAIMPRVLDLNRMAGSFVGRVGKREKEIKKVFEGR